MSFSLTRKTDYALVALTRLAEEANGTQRALSARQIAEQYDLPLPLLMNVLKDLHKANIVCSRRGPSGGYMLCCHDPSQITMLQVIEALEGRVQVALCCDEEESPGAEPCVPCRVLAKCPNVRPMQKFNDLVRDFLSQVTLKDLIDREKTWGLRLVASRQALGRRPQTSGVLT
jgi:Rrf2 family protein